MKRTLVLGIMLVGGLVGLLAFDGATPAYATGGPHGDYSATTDFCAACHRAHTAVGSQDLLKDAAGPGVTRAVDMCKSCHNGSGSALDVMDGLRIDLTAPGGYTVPKATSATQLEVTVAPAAKSLTTTGTDSTTYTINVKNVSAAAITGLIARTQTNTTATQFDLDVLSVTTFTALAAGATLAPAPVLTVGTGSGAAVGQVNLSTVTATVTATGENAAVKVNTRIGSWLLLGGGYQYINGVAVTSTHFNAVAGTEQAVDDSRKPWGYAGTDATRSSYAAITAGTTWAAADADPGQAGRRPSGAVLLASKLECISCHNPHGNTNYRMLNAVINGYNVNVKAYSEGARVYNDGVGGSEAARRGLDGATAAAASKYTDSYETYFTVGSNVLTEASLTQGANDTNANFASFCSACHTAYASDTAQGGLTAQTVTRYRHRTEEAVTGRPGCGGTCGAATNPEIGVSRLYPSLTMRLASSSATANEFVTCTTCHRSHGTASAMGTYSQGANTATGGGVATGKASLLFYDNRGVCQTCHQW